MMKTLKVIVLGLSLACTLTARAVAHDPAEHIIHVMKAQFDKPDNPLAVEPVSVVGDFAVAGWSQGGMGGRALLKRADGTWTIHLCAGAGLRQAQVLHEAGMDMASAEQLAALVAADEAKLDPAKPALYDSFQGTVMIGAQGHAGHQHKHGDAQGGEAQTQ